MSVTAKDEQIILALLEAPTLEKASKICGIGKTCIRKKLEKAEFKEAYESEKLALMEECIATLRKNLLKCTEEISEIATNKNNAPQVRLNACDCVIRNILKLNEQYEILKRLEKIENKYNEVNRQ